MVLQVPGVAVRIATAIPGLEAHLAYAISSSDQTRADPHVRQITSARWVSLAPMELTWALPVDVTLLAFLFRLVVRIISGPVEGGKIPSYAYFRRRYWGRSKIGGVLRRERGRGAND